MTALFDALRAQRRALGFAFAVALVLGVGAALRLPAAILPDVTFPRLTVIADVGELPTDPMLREVTRPLEQSVRRVPGLRELRTTTSRGSVEMNLDFDWGSDMNLALQRVEAQIGAARSSLPAGAAIDARLMSPALFPVLGYSLVSKTRSLAELRDLALMRLQPALSRLPGCAEVVVQGGRRLEARVELDPTALQARGLDPSRVADALRESGELQSIGLLEANRELYLGLADARPVDLASLERVSVPVDGGVVPLGALGRVRLTEAPEFTRYRAQGREAVLVSLLRAPSANTIALTDAAERWFREHRRELPADVQVQVFYDQSRLVTASVHGVRDSLLVGALLAIGIVALFLGSLRLGLAGALVLPGAIALTALGLRFAGESFDMMTLGGIAAAVGLVLDDAIVVVEHLAHRAGAGVGVSRAMAELLPSLAGSSLCTLAIFLPFLGLSGVTGAFFRVLALSMSLMLASSFVLCVTLLPLLAPRLAPRPERAGPLAARRLLQAFVARPLLGVAVVLACVAASAALLAGIGTGFLPEMDEGALILDYVSPPGTSLGETDRVLIEVEKLIAATPEIESWSRRTGDQLGFFITEPNTGDYVLTLKRRRHRSAEEVADDLRGRIEATQPALQIEFGQLVEDVVGDLTTNPQPIEVRVLGEDAPVLHQRAAAAAAALEKLRGVVDVNSGVVVAGPNVSIVPGPMAARLGLGVGDLAVAAQAAVQGLDAGQIVRGARAWPVRVVVPGPVGSARELTRLRVATSAGHAAALGDLASIRIEPGEAEIARDNGRTYVGVTARLANRDLGSAMAEVQRTLARTLALPADMSLEYGGLWAEQQSSFRGLSAVLAGAIASVLLLMLVAFRSWRIVGAVLAVTLASLAGVFAALRVSGATLNISSFVGAIMMVGIVSENAFFLVSEFRSRMDAGAGRAEAASDAARRRARPVLMTTAAGIAALAPLAIGLGSGSALLQPLAIAVIGGFAVSALLLLLVLPSLLAGMGARGDAEGEGGAIPEHASS